MKDPNINELKQRCKEEQLRNAPQWCERVIKQLLQLIVGKGNSTSYWIMDLFSFTNTASVFGLAFVE